MRTLRRLVLSSVILGLTVTSSGLPGLRAAQEPGQPPADRGRTATVLSDGSVLLLGGEGGPAHASLHDGRTQTTRLLSRMRVPRAWHTATVLPDGTVLVAGGVGPDGQMVQEVERFNPSTGAFEEMDTSFTPRAHHTATLLTDGRILFAGGDTPGGGGVRAELWDGRTNNTDAVSTPADVGRVDGVAALLPDGRVRITGGRLRGRRAAPSADVFDPAAMAFVDDTFASPPTPVAGDGVAAVLPADQATDVSPDTRISLRLSTPIDARTVVVTVETIDGPAAIALPVIVVSAEGGRLLFVTPAAPLPSDSEVRVTLRSARTAAGRAVPLFSAAFRTARSPDPADPSNPRDDHPTAGARGLDSPWRKLPPLQAPAGVTALAGQVLLLNGAPLADVTLAIGERKVRTDRTGRFLMRLGSAPSGWSELLIDGTTANRPRRTYGVFEVAVQIVGRKTAPLPYTIWMPTIDSANAVRIPSPTAQETVITTPRIPGLELHLPPQTVITDHEGKVVREISITPIPVDQPPFPLPSGVQVPIYFTIQPGGAYVAVHAYGNARKGAWLVYPNYTNRPVGTEHQFWHYDPEEKGWHVYGMGAVAPRRRASRTESRRRSLRVHRCDDQRRAKPWR